MRLAPEMPALATLAISCYDTALKASIAGQPYFDTALYPPVFRIDFDVGTVFSYTQNGGIITYDHEVMVRYFFSLLWAK